MTEDIDFKRAMRDVRRLKPESVSSSRQAQSLSHYNLKREIEGRASRFADEQTSAPLSIANSDHGESNETGESTLFFLRHGLQKKILRDLKKGSRYSIDHILDLHGLTQAQAQTAIEKEISLLQNNGTNCLLIIHGKGLRSKDIATLKHFCADYLKSLAAVKAYCSAQRHDGGTGALYVLVK